MTAALGDDQDAAQWRCRKCGRLMGELFRHKVHLRPHRGHTYFSPYPLTGVCGNCGCRNTIMGFPPR